MEGTKDEIKNNPIPDTISNSFKEDTSVKMQDFFETTINDIDTFDAQAYAKGDGYKAPNFPIFDDKMEGLDSGLYMFAGESNMGKALRLSTPILKANGEWSTIGDVQVGDQVWGDDGIPTKIVCKSKIFTDHKCYKLTFDDNTEIFADADHLWKVYKHCYHKSYNIKMILKTSDIFKNFKHIDPNGSPHYNYRVPMQKALRYEEKELPIDPYVFGIWLGNGRGKNHDNLLDKLKNLELFHDKHIPKIYLHSSIEQRWELLKGLMDISGYCHEDGSCEFIQESASKINETFGELLSSLGIKWTMTSKITTYNGEDFPETHFKFICDKTHPCFGLPEKFNKLRAHLKNKSIKYKTIVDISEIPSEPMQCIEVNNKSHCFCVDKTMTVTHNTAVLQALAYDYAMCEENNLFCVYFALDDTIKDILPRIIAMTQDIPISVAAKPQRYENMIAGHHELSPIYADMLMKRSTGIDFLKSEKFRKHFKVVDGTSIECGEQILDYCQKVKCYLEAYNPDMKLMVVIDSLSDISFATKTFKSDKELNDHIAKQVKKWAVEILDCPIFGSLHLRKIDQNRRPTIADVKESGRYAYEASVLFLVHNDVSRNKQAASICMRSDESDELIPVIELDWAKNKKSSFKGRTYQSFITNLSKVTECSKEVSDRFDSLIYSV